MSPCLIALMNSALRLGVHRWLVPGFGRSCAMMTAPSHHMVGKGVVLGAAFMWRCLRVDKGTERTGPTHPWLPALRPVRVAASLADPQNTTGHRSLLDDKLYASATSK